MVTSCLGALGNLTIVVFAPGSYFDRVITLDVEGCKSSSLNASIRVGNGNAGMILTLLVQELILQGVVDMDAVGLGSCMGTIQSQ